jgi:very-short-patch-repair endonuclease
MRESNSSSSTTGNIVANIEIDGHHHKQAHKLYFTSLRDHYFQHHYGFPVLRQDVSGRMKTRDEVKEDVRRILKGLGIMKKE